MSRPTKKSTNVEAEFANLLADKITEQMKQLFGRNYPEIQKLMTDDGEVAITFKTRITNRDAEEGHVAEKDQSIRTSIAFSIKFSDSIEGALPDPTQPELSMEPAEDLP